MGYPRQDYTTDSSVSLGSATVGAAATGTSSSSVDLGSTDPVEFEVIVDVTACGVAAGMTAYVHVEGGTDSTFTTTPIALATFALGVAADLNTNLNVGSSNRGVGVYRVKLSNQTTFGGVASQIRYVRCRHKTIGAGGSLTYSATLAKC